MGSDLILLHSPLVGPYTWQLAAEEIRRRGRRAIVPSLLDALSSASNFSQALVDCVLQGIAETPRDRPLMLVAHSAAGFFLPAIRAGLKHPVTAYLFVDARLPQAGASLFDDSSPEEVRKLRTLAVDGWLPRWSDWFGEGVMEQVVPDETMRTRFRAELQSLPLSLFEEKVPPFRDWPDAPCGYLRLSEFYTPQAEYARSAGWSVREMDAAHLQMLVDPPKVVDAMMDLAGGLAS